jgi:cyclophilin family peptidyl-prolyl cis-trans isomerase
VLAQLKADYPEDVRLAYRHYPLKEIHDKALLAAQGSEAAGLQGKFWEMHDLLFEQQQEWQAFSVEQFQDWLIERAGELELDVDQFTADLNSGELVALAEEAYERNASIGMPGTPFLVINGSPYGGPRDYGNLESVVKALLLEQNQYAQCPPMNIDPDKRYLATLKTEKGEVVLELFAQQAPMAVNNFIFLAREGWYDGVTFHRVLPGFVAQGGDPSGTGLGGPGYAFENEVDPSLTFDGPGILAMANAGPDTNGSQFFITYAATPQLNGGYTIFGRVIAGMDVVEQLTERDPSKGMDLPPGDRILSVTIEEQ